MTIIKNKRSGKYHAVIRTQYGRKTISTGTRDKSEAEQVVKKAGLREIEAAGRAGRMGAVAVSQIVSGRKITLNQAVDEWGQWMASVGQAPRTVANYLETIASFAKTYGSLVPAMVTTQQIDAWTNDPTRYQKRNTLHLRLSVVRSLFTFCSARGWIAGNPAKLVRVRMDLLSHAQREAKPIRTFTDDEIVELIDTAEKLADECEAESKGRRSAKREEAARRAINWRFWSAAVAIGRWTGLRLGDICSLEWSCLTTEQGKLVCWNDKHDARVSLPLEPKALAYALAGVKKRDERFLFPEYQEAAHDVRRRSLMSVQFARLCERVGIQGKSFHGLRHTFASQLKREGKPLWFVADALGHAYRKETFDVTRRYTDH